VNLNPKLKSSNSDEDKEKLKELLSNTKKEISEIVPGKVLNEIAYHHFGLKYGSCFEASIGAESIYSIFKNLDLDKLKIETEELILKASSLDKEKLQKRLSLGSFNVGF
jgi:hypothetical protein